MAYKWKVRIESQRAPQKRDRGCVTLLVDVQQSEPGRGLRVPRGRQPEIGLEGRLRLVVASLHGKRCAKVVVGVRLLRPL